AGGAWVIEDADSRNGSYVEGRRIARLPIVDGTSFELGHTHFLFRSTLLPGPLLDSPLDVAAPSAHEAALATLSHERVALFRRMVDAARAGTSILLMGEAGCGKDTLARAIHAEAGGRRAFVVVHGVLLGRRMEAGGSEDDVTTELVRDFNRAEGGTLFLDGIEELSPVAQLALLPLLKSRRAGVASIVSSVRSSDPRPAVPRIPADLLAELAGFAARVPPLRERREDIGMLVAHLVRRAAAGDRALRATTIDPAMGRALLLHDWPYNLSELDRCVRTSYAAATDNRMGWSPPSLFGQRAPSPPEPPADEPILRPSEPPFRAADGARPPSEPPFGAAEPPADTMPEPDAEFAQNVRRALKCNLSVAGLHKNALLRAHMVLESTDGVSTATVAVPALRRIFLEAIESMRGASPRGEKQSSVLHLTFIKPAVTQQAAADQLAMAYGTYRRYVTAALAELTTILWFEECAARLRYDRRLASGRDRAEHEPMG
ncbi:MAG: sigma 54-interacting transcriptional regulator, partial [Myxococcota bacterium]|nr:sigma 54-interacting transcriptional regulator [Myxococcota bacterium]